MDFFRTVLTVSILTSTISVHAYDFQLLPENFTTNDPTATHNCIANASFDSSNATFGCKITDGAVIGTDSSGNLYALPDGTTANFPDSTAAPVLTLTVLDSNTSDLLVDGATIGQAAGQVKVGTFTDYVLSDTRDGNLVFAVRVVLDPTVNGIANQYEINNVFRDGYTGFSAAIGWSRGSDADLRMYRGTRTAAFFNSEDPVSYDPDRVRINSDVNVSEGNPRSGYFFIKTNATGYTTIPSAISFFQAGEEGQPINLVSFSGFAPSSTAPVPLPLWSLGIMALALGLLVNYSKKNN